MNVMIYATICLGRKYRDQELIVSSKWRFAQSLHHSLEGERATAKKFMNAHSYRNIGILDNFLRNYILGKAYSGFLHITLFQESIEDKILKSLAIDDRRTFSWMKGTLALQKFRMYVLELTTATMYHIFKYWP